MKKYKIKLNTKFAKNFLFHSICIGLVSEREKRWKSKVSYFLFLSCLWEEGRLNRTNLYPAAEGDNSGIWTYGYLDLLPPPLLLSADHSMDRAICLISSFCFCPIEFRIPSNSPWAEYILIKLLLILSKLSVQHFSL